MARTQKPMPRTASCPRRVTTSSPSSQRSQYPWRSSRPASSWSACAPQSNFSSRTDITEEGSGIRNTAIQKEAGGTVGGDRYRGGGRHLLRRRRSISLCAGVQDLRRSPRPANAEGLDTRKGTKITIHATGKDSSGNSVAACSTRGRTLRTSPSGREITALRSRRHPSRRTEPSTTPRARPRRSASTRTAKSTSTRKSPSSLSPQKR